MIDYPEDMARTTDAKKAHIATRVRGPYFRLPNGMIDCEFYVSDKEGWCPYTSCPNDEYEHCNLIHEVCSDRIAQGEPVTEKSFPVFVDEPDPRDAKIADLEARLAALEAKA